MKENKRREPKKFKGSCDVFATLPVEILDQILSYFPLIEERLLFRLVNKKFNDSVEKYGWESVYGLSDAGIKKVYRQVLGKIHITLKKYNPN